MASCGCENDVRFDGLSPAYRRALWAVIAINGAMFLVEMAAGMLAGSQALKADALDFLGDTATYSISLFVIGMPLVWRARAALVKGLSLGAMGLWVLGTTAYHVLVLGVPQAEVMGAIGFLALVANLTSVLLLLKFRDGHANIRFGLALQPQRRCWQSRRDLSGKRRVGHWDGMARPHRRRHHGDPVLLVVGADRSSSRGGAAYGKEFLSVRFGSLTDLLLSDHPLWANPLGVWIALKQVALRPDGGDAKRSPLGIA